MGLERNDTQNPKLNILVSPIPNYVMVPNVLGGNVVLSVVASKDKRRKKYLKSC